MKAFLIVVVAVAVVAATYAGVQTMKQPPAHPPMIMVVPNGTSFNVGPGKYISKNFSLDWNETLTGKFATTGNVTVYVMTDSQFKGILSSGKPDSFLSRNMAPRSVLDYSLGVGTYHLVFYNGDSNQSLRVTITEDIVAS